MRGIHWLPANSPPTHTHTQRPLTQSLDVFFDLHLNKRFSKQSWGRWFETLSCSLWHHCNEAMAACWHVLLLSSVQYSAAKTATICHSSLVIWSRCTDGQQIGSYLDFLVYLMSDIFVPHSASPITTFRSNSKLDQNLKCPGLKCTQLITIKFCTNHNSVTIMICAKFCCDQLSMF